MGRIDEFYRDHLSTPNKIRAYYKLREWDFSPNNLDNLAFIKKSSHQFTGNEIAEFNKDNKDFPSVSDLFDLAVDFRTGSSQCQLHKRLRVARQMARQTQKSISRSLGRFRTYRESSAYVKVNKYERGDSRPSDEIRDKLAINEFHVDPLWLAGKNKQEHPTTLFIDPGNTVKGECGNFDRNPYAIGYQSDEINPPWLTPWIQAIDSAIFAIKLVNCNYFLSNGNYASEMLQSFFEKHKPITPTTYKKTGFILVTSSGNVINDASLEEFHNNQESLQMEKEKCIHRLLV